MYGGIQYYPYETSSDSPVYRWITILRYIINLYHFRHSVECNSCKHDTSIQATPITTADTISYTVSNPLMYTPDGELGQVSDRYFGLMRESEEST